MNSKETEQPTPKKDPNKITIERELMLAMAYQIGSLSASIKHIRMDAEGINRNAELIEGDLENIGEIMKQMKEGSSSKEKKK